MLDVIVIGAGMAGVTAARELTRQGLSALVVEARERIGGRLWSNRDLCGLPVECGAEFIHGVGARTWPEVQAAGLSTRPLPLVRHTLANMGGSTRWLPWIVLHPGMWPCLPLLGSVRHAGLPDRSVRELIEAKHYTGRARVMAEMALTAHLPGTIDEVGVLGLSADGVLQLETGLNHRIVEGYDSLVCALAERLDVQLGFQVSVVRWSGDGVAVREASGLEISARAAICTLPVGVLRSGSVRFDPALPEVKRTALEQIEMGPVAKILLHFHEPFWPRWAANIACGTGPVTLYWPVFYRAGAGPAVLTAYCTGPRAAALSRMGDEEAVATVLEDLKRLFPKAEPRRELLGYRRIDWATDPFARGGYTFLRKGGVGARARLRAADTGRLFWAGSATEWRPIAATVEAAYSSGLRAAEEVSALLSEGAGAALRAQPVRKAAISAAS